jgi:DNA polymerase
MTETPSPRQVREDLRSYLKFLQRSGFLYLTPKPGAEAGAPAGPSLHSRVGELEALRIAAANCAKCRLSQGRTYVVFGEGNPDADILFVGEAPGADEDRLARPFVGRAGQLLDKMMTHVGLRREDVFITNLNKCRPPENRDPMPDEIEACQPYLWRQIELIQPRVIVALGRFAAHALTGTQTPITQMRGRLYRYRDVPLMPTLHPAAVLRNMGQLPLVHEDLRRAIQAAAEPVTAAPEPQQS